MAAGRAGVAESGGAQALRAWTSEVRAMPHSPETPFDSIEGAHEYVRLLCETIAEARAAVEEDALVAQEVGAARRLDALTIVTYKLDRLQAHMVAGRQLLNDLRTLRRLLLDERRESLNETSETSDGDDEVVGIG